jgi:hypothetical protein
LRLGNMAYAEDTSKHLPKPSISSSSVERVTYCRSCSYPSSSLNDQKPPTDHQPFTADNIPTTNPLRIRSLWEVVHCRTRDVTMPPSRGRVRGSKGSMHASHETEDVSRESCEDVLSARVIPESASYTASSASTPQTQDTTVTRRSRKYAAPRDASFREEVLESRGIIIKGNTLSLPDPFVHFASGRTTETNYKELPGLENLHIWLQTDPDFLKEISEEYSCMVQNLQPSGKRDFSKQSLADSQSLKIADGGPRG